MWQVQHRWTRLEFISFGCLQHFSRNTIFGFAILLKQHPRTLLFQLHSHGLAMSLPDQEPRLYVKNLRYAVTKFETWTGPSIFCLTPNLLYLKGDRICIPFFLDKKLGTAQEVRRFLENRGVPGCYDIKICRKESVDGSHSRYCCVFLKFSDVTWLFLAKECPFFEHQKIFQLFLGSIYEYFFTCLANHYLR